MRHISLYVYSLLFITSGLLFSSCAGSTNLQDTSNNSNINPISVSNSRSVSFYKISFDIENGKELGNHHKGLARLEYDTHRWEYGTISGSGELKESANKALSNHDYNVPSGGGDMFEQDNTNKAKYQLGAEVIDLKYNTYGSLAGGFKESKMHINWKVFDTSSERTVYEKQTSGYSKSESGRSSFKESFMNAFYKLLSDSDFASKLEERGSYENDKEKENIGIVKKSESLNIPEEIEVVNKSTATILVGTGHGTGFFVSKEGYIITAAHVVSGLQEVDVKTSNGINISANVVRKSENHDVALLKAEGSGFDFLSISEDEQDIGRDVYAIGTPINRELSNSVAKGVLSQYRNIDGVESIQTDVSVNPGNSGGPLINSSGKVIGVVSWKFSTQSGYEGVSFAVSMREAIDELGISVLR